MKDRNTKEYFSELGSQSTFDKEMCGQLKNELIAAEKIRQITNPNTIRMELEIQEKIRFEKENPKKDKYG